MDIMCEGLDGLVEKAVRFADDVHGGDRGGHGIDHVRRVMNNAAMLLETEHGADVYTVMLCCALHDVDDRKLRATGKGERENLYRFCADNGLSFELRDTLASIISSVSFSDNPSKNESLTLEAKIVQDADRLDALGAIGIARAFAYGGKHGRPFFAADGEESTVGHFYTKLFKLPELMNTTAAKGIALSRVKYMRAFLNELNAESNGEQ